MKTILPITYKAAGVIIDEIVYFYKMSSQRCFSTCSFPVRMVVIRQLFLVRGTYELLSLGKIKSLKTAACLVGVNLKIFALTGVYDIQIFNWRGSCDTVTTPRSCHKSIKMDTDNYYHCSRYSLFLNALCV